MAPPLPPLPAPPASLKKRPNALPCAPIASEAGVKVVLLVQGDYTPVVANALVQVESALNTTYHSFLASLIETCLLFSFQFIKSGNTFQIRIHINGEVFGIHIIATDRFEAAPNDETFLAVSDATTKATYGLKFISTASIQNFRLPANEALRSYCQEQIPLPVMRHGPEALRSAGCSITVGWHLPEQIIPITEG